MPRMRWNVDPILAKLGPITLRWYGLFFAIGLALGIRQLALTFQRRGFPAKHASALMLWTPIGMILGAHLIHLIFYEPRAFIENPIRIFEIGKGLASHGGGLGAIVAVAIYAKRKGADVHAYCDAVMAAAIWVIPWVRVGNFFNSEIYGRPTTLPWGVIFVRRGFTKPRHPSQVYEAALAFGLVLTGWILERTRLDKMRPGALFYLLLLIYFVTRFFIEYVKEYQTISPGFPFTMGQMLSLPVVLLCVYMLFFSKTHNIRTPPDKPVGPHLAGPEAQDSSGKSSSVVKTKTKKKRKKR
ncbi:MAG: prolipoprotein diacylglyceryl transferase [Myxococcales bacterium]|nr:prolipoprotein diacylglyceryl transferase [Myxococcales bacterium]